MLGHKQASIKKNTDMYQFAENDVLQVLTHRWVLNNENTWTQGGEHHTLGSVGGNRGGTMGDGELGRDSMQRNARYN